MIRASLGRGWRAFPFLALATLLPAQNAAPPLSPGSPSPGAAYARNINPGPAWHHVIAAHLRFELSRYLPADSRYGVALAAHANNLINREVWLPSGLYSVDTIPVQQGRVVYVGLEFSAGKNPR